jgi:thiosulfate/3-mercaptopyruvate sulfurtransferase
MLPTPLVSPDVLSALLRDPNAAHSLVLLDVRPGASGRDAYREAHLSGAIHADLDRDLADTSGDPRLGGRHPLPALDVWCGTLGRWGVRPLTSVVCYDAASGANAAARAWWMLRAVGHERVAVLDGGIQAALAAGVATDDLAPTVERAPPYPAARWQLPTSGADEVARRASDPNWRLIDARSGERHRGESEPFDPVAGSIPGALHLFFGTLLHESGRLLAPDAVRERFAGAGVVDLERTIVHCGSGVTACLLALAAERAGLAVPSLYVGSWSEWCRQGRPNARGRTSAQAGEGA